MGMELALQRLTGRRSRYGRVLLLAASLAVGAGCAPVWHLHYDEAERLARTQKRALVVFYKAPFDTQSGQLEDLLETPQASALLRDKVRCMLTTEFAPHRKYAAQYGAMQAPALVIIHDDGTYHSRQGSMNLQELQSFFAQAKAPGSRPQLDPQIPRPIDYRWQGIYEDAVSLARRQNRELLIVYKWWLSPESTELLNLFLVRPEVARHFTETVNCLLDMDYLPNRTHMRRYGATQVPSVVLVHRDGTYHAHTGPMTAEQIVRFVTTSKAPGRKPGSGPAAVAASPRVSVNWYTDFSRAAAHARHRGVNLFVFFTSLYSEQSNRMARLLEQEDVAALFSNTINCKLDFSAPANRQLMAQYRVSRAPAFLIVRPDSTYHVRTGTVSERDLAALVQAAHRPGLTPRAIATDP